MRPGLLGINPELQRLLWLEFSLTRLVAMPVVLVALVAAVDSTAGAGPAGRTAIFLAGLLAVVWGSRLAAESFGEEVAGRTWDGQRLSSLHPWTLTTGKLVGGALYAWYGVAICAGLLLYLGDSGAFSTGGSALVDFGRVCAAGALAQAAGLLTGLVLHRLDPASRRGQTTIAQIAALVIAFYLFALWQAIDKGSHLISAGRDLAWYGIAVPVHFFAWLVLLSAWVWLAIASQRLVRRELGYRAGPLGWLGFTVFVLGVELGLVPDGISGWLGSSVLGLGALQAAAITYLAAYASPASAVEFRRLSLALSSGRPDGVWIALPPWLPSAAIAVVLGVASAVAWTANRGPGLDPLSFPAYLGFFVRDLSIIAFVRLRYRRRTVLPLLILFGLLYLILPMLFAPSSAPVLSGLFLPPRPTFLGFSHPGTLFSAVVPWVEAALPVVLVARLLRPPVRAR